MEDVEQLVVAPFRQVVDAGRTAVGNAVDATPMMKAAQDLVKCGERALKLLEPLCKRNFDDYGLNFLKALKGNDDIGQFLFELETLLFEFEEYVTAVDFDAEKFSELQKMSNQAAVKIGTSIKRMILEPSSHDPRPLSPPSSPGLGTVGPQTPGSISQSRGSYASSQADNRLSVGRAAMMDGNVHLERPLDRPVSELDMSALHIVPSPPEEAERQPEPAEQPPPPPDTNPWDPHAAVMAGDGQALEITEMERRPFVAPSGSMSECSPLSSSFEKKFTFPRRPVGNRFSDHDIYVERERRFDSIALPPNTSLPMVGHVPRSSSGENVFPQIDEETETAERENATKPIDIPFSPSSYGDPPFLSKTLPHFKSDTFAGHSRDVGASGSNAVDGLSISHNSNIYSHSPKSVPATIYSGEGIEVVQRRPALDSEGPIPVEEDNAPVTLVHIPSQDASIGSGSSFYLLKGFCEGAKEVVQGKIGVRKTKRPVGFGAASTVARCVSCLYELDFNQIEADVKKKDAGNFTKSGVGFRIRFLQKSHIHAKRVDDILYGCVFCVHQGRTTDESDATAFFTAAGLFSHLARHPRPLPDVPGITVIDQVEVPEQHRNDFDLHFINPPLPHLALENAAEIANLPKGTAREAARRISGQRMLPDRSQALEFLQGSRITGISWPSKYHGEWACAWHDGIHATVPTDLIKLDMPPSSEIKLGGTSHIRARARWKFTPKEKDRGDWLKFDKGEMITNISWPYAEHWCWSGTNSRGKWGIFPQVFLDTNTVQEPSTGGPNRANDLNNERNRSMSILSRISTRRTSGRPASIAESTSSRETNTGITAGFLARASRASRGSRGSGDFSGL